LAKRSIIPAIIVHGGAGDGQYKWDLPRYKKEMVDALAEGMRELKRGMALDAVEAAVRRMEYSGAFNAGRGSVLTSDGRMQLDAAIMSGRGLEAGAVGASACTHNPISLARHIMEGKKSVLIVGEDCRSAAIEAGITIESLRPTLTVRKKFDEMKGAKPQGKTGTVGAVAIDGDRNPAAAVSTGGLWLKHPGRVGDSAIIGAGIYADSSSGAACATGVGEEIMRNALSWEACRNMERFDAVSAARYSIERLTKRSGNGLAGVITVDVKGRIGLAYNTKMMGRAWFDNVKEKIVVEV
jgi:beta-aspartyl-peptidase (threonine type)